MKMSFPIFTAPFTVGSSVAEDIINVWQNRPAKEELNDCNWECFAVSAEMMLTPEITIAYYYPKEGDDGWVQIEDNEGDIDYPVRHIGMNENHSMLDIYFGIQLLSLHIVPDDEFDPFIRMCNEDVLDKFYPEEKTSEDEDTVAYVDEEGFVSKAERYHKSSSKLEGYQ